MKNEKLLLDIQIECGNISNKILNAAINAEQTFKWKWPYQTRTLGNIPTYQCRTDTFKHSFFPSTIIIWKKMHPETRNASPTVFKKHLLKKICPVPHSVYKIRNPNNLKLLTTIIHKIFKTNSSFHLK